MADLTPALARHPSPTGEGTVIGPPPPASQAPPLLAGHPGASPDRAEKQRIALRSQGESEAEGPGGEVYTSPTSESELL